MKFRLLKAIAKFVVVLVVVAAAGGFYLFYRAMPAYSGAATLPGLRAETRVWRDGYGVPHIFAASMDDAARALGYIHASERLYQMEMQRRAGQGRVAEIAGADYVDVDRLVRTLGLYRLAESSFAALSPWAQARLQAYADGVNAFLTTHQNALPPEFLFLGDAPEPWKPADTLVWGKLASLQLSGNYKLEALRAHLQQKLSPEQASWLFAMPTDHAPITTAPTANPRRAAIDDAADRLAELIPLRHGASNEWVVSGARTVTGKPILADDPHLSVGAPILWYLVRIVTPEGSLKGATVPGFPAVMLGQNDRIAWGVTNAASDVQDLFVETIDPADPGRYLTPDGPKPFATRDETIHVKGGADVVLHVRETRHGPVVSDVVADLAGLAGAGKAVALAYTGLGGQDTSAESLMRVNAAHDWDEFLAALRLYQTATQNFVYADASGDIGYISAGLVPLRKSGDGLAPADGASGEKDWVGTIPFERWPQLHNPEAGFVFNANNAIVGDDGPSAFGQDWEEPFRARRIQQFFDTIDKHSLETSAAMQADHVSLAAKDMLPLVKTITPSDERARPRRRARAHRQARRRRHEQMEVGRRARHLAAARALQPYPAARLGQRPQRAGERRLLHAGPRRRLRGSIRSALCAHPRRGLSRRLRSRRPRQVALHHRHRPVRSYLVAPLSRLRRAVVRHEIDYARRERGGAEARRGAGVHLHAAIARVLRRAATAQKKSVTTTQPIVDTP
jgi:penicillin amidase